MSDSLYPRISCWRNTLHTSTSTVAAAGSVVSPSEKLFDGLPGSHDSRCSRDIAPPRHLHPWTRQPPASPTAVFRHAFAFDASCGHTQFIPRETTRKGRRKVSHCDGSFSWRDLLTATLAFAANDPITTRLPHTHRSNHSMQSLH